MSNLDPEPWSISKWCAMIGSLIGVQAVLVFLFSERGTMLPESKNVPPAVFYLGAGLDQLSLTHRTLARDASLLSRPHTHSFTGALWEQSLDPEREYSYWTENPRYYSRDKYVAGAAFKEYVLQHKVPASVVSRSLPELSDAERPQALPQPKSFFTVAGGIRERVPRQFESLPAWAHTNLVSPTVISVALDQFGWAHSAVMISNSLPAVDDHARQWLRRTQFESLPLRNDGVDPGLTWGEITFRWATLPATNSVPAAVPQP